MKNPMETLNGTFELSGNSGTLVQPVPESTKRSKRLLGAFGFGARQGRCLKARRQGPPT